MKKFIRHRVLSPLGLLLRQGVSPNRLAWALAVGAGVGVVPILGVSTWLCVIVAAAFRLNQVAIQIGSWVIYPLQILLIIPFLRAGEWIFGAPPISLDITEMLSQFQLSPVQFLSTYSATALRGTVAWVVIVPIPILIIQWLLHVIIRYTTRKRDVTP